MGGASSQKVKGVGQKVQDGAQAGTRSGGAAGQIDHQGSSGGVASLGVRDRSRERAAERGPWGFRAWETARMRSLKPSSSRSQTARVASGVTSRGAEAGASRGDDELRVRGVMAQGGLNKSLVVGEDCGLDLVQPFLAEEGHDGGTGGIRLQTLGAAVGDGEDHGAGLVSKWADLVCRVQDHGG